MDRSRIAPRFRNHQAFSIRIHSTYRLCTSLVLRSASQHQRGGLCRPQRRLHAQRILAVAIISLFCLCDKEP